MFEKKVKIHCPVNWNHHRYGWNYVVNSMKENLHNDLGIDFFTNGLYEKMISSKQIHKKPWIGILHITPSDPGMKNNLENNECWHKSLKQCRGIYTLSNHGKQFLEKYTNCNIEKLYYPGTPEGIKFNLIDYENNPNKKIYFIGHWLRNIEPFNQLKTKYEKVKKHLPQDEYDNIFKKNLVFLYLTDSSANTTVLECIKSNTPIIINRLPALEEYLGINYPLFYNNLKEAEELINSQDKIVSGHLYLFNMNKSHLTIESFISDILNSKIYKSINLIKL